MQLILVDSKKYAVKILHSYDSHLDAEIGIQKSLSHPNIVQLYESFVDTSGRVPFDFIVDLLLTRLGLYYLVMELCETDVQKFLDRDHANVLNLYDNSILTLCQGKCHLLRAMQRTY
jgi:serine/threonine protein kinase